MLKETAFANEQSVRYARSPSSLDQNRLVSVEKLQRKTKQPWEPTVAYFMEDDLPSPAQYHDAPVLDLDQVRRQAFENAKQLVIVKADSYRTCSKFPYG